MSIDALIRIAFAMAFLFVIVPWLAWPRRVSATFLESFFWNLGVGIALITIAGQLLSLGNLFSLPTLLIVSGLLILFGQSTWRGIPPWTLVKQSSERAFLAILNIFDRRVKVRRRIRRTYRRIVRALREKTASRLVRMQIAAWIALTAIAAGFRLYRPLVSANLGFSDTYGHLYLLKLLEDGRQVDPAWGPYPRGMHFLLMAIHNLTNVDPILLMNFFGAVAGVLMTLAVAHAARRLSGNLIAGLLAGLLFATFVGGPGQYLVVGGAFATEDRSAARSLAHVSYRELLPNAGEFDLALTAFQRQTTTLPQELAIALLFPAALFLLDFLRRRERWHLIGYAGCTAAIAAVHSGVLVPLVLMSALAVVATMIDRSLAPGAFTKALVAGMASVFVGSAWALAFIAYPYTAGGQERSVGRGALYYFPFLRSLSKDPAVAVDDIPILVTLTPFLMVCIGIAIALLVSAFVRRDGFRANRIWTASVFLLFLAMHFASMNRWPQFVETTRNSQWLLMSMMVLIGVGVADLGSMARFIPTLKTATATGVAALIVFALWTIRVPLPSQPVIRNRIVNYSGYGGSALAVLRITRSFEPYTWTLVSYGQEFPMVLRQGFHVPAADFLERYDPGAEVTPIPTPYVFVIVEKIPHRFEINAWTPRFSRAELEQRLQTWIQLYQATHRNLRVFLEDENVRVYQIERTPEEIKRLSRQVSR